MAAAVAKLPKLQLLQWRRPACCQVAASRSRRRVLCARASLGQENQLRAAAKFVVDKYLRPGQTIGLGTGLAVNAVIEEIAKRIDAGELQGLKCVPASTISASEAAFHGVPLTTQAEVGQPLDVLLEVADELDGSDPGLGFIAGRASKPQQPQLVRARQLATAAATCVVLVNSPDQVVSRLGGELPVVVEAEGWEDTGEELDDIFIGDADIWRRSVVDGAGPRGGDRPYLSPDGHNILDIKFYEEGLRLFGEDVAYAAIAREIEGVPGVVAHGLYADVAAAAVVATEEGPLEVLRGEPLSVGSMEE